jgi:hypothetical protein
MPGCCRACSCSTPACCGSTGMCLEPLEAATVTPFEATFVGRGRPAPRRADADRKFGMVGVEDAQRARDAGALPGHRREPDDRGGARQDPARDAVRGGDAPRPGRRPRVLRLRRRHPAVGDVARRAAALGSRRRRRHPVVAARRRRARLDRHLRRPRRRRLRRVSAGDTGGPRQPGV